MAPKKSRKKGKKRGVAKSKRRQPKGDEGSSAVAESVVPGVEAHREALAMQLFQLASQHALGDGVERSDEEAARYCREAADLGLREAQSQLGVLYENGKGVPQDLSEAALWYRLASNQGLASAHFNLGMLYLHGLGVPRDRKEAARLFRLAADAGRADAQFSLGLIYRDGDGVGHDYTEAAHWFKLAAAQDHAGAQGELGRLYLIHGQGVPQVFDEARRLLELSAVQGNAAAFINLGKMYLFGLGVEKNVALAKQYYRRAGKDDCELASGQTTKERMTEQLYAIKHTCASCETTGDALKVCTRCKGPRYCGVACQRKDWPVHKRVCQRLAKTEEGGLAGASANGMMSGDANDL